jgi:hypothetical protein
MADTENKRRRVEMADKTTRTGEARGFRVDHARLCWWCRPDEPRTMWRETLLTIEQAC